MDVFKALINAFGSEKGDPNFDPNVDFNGDGLINSTDWSIAKQKYGSPAPTSTVSAATSSVASDMDTKGYVMEYNLGLVNLVMDAFGSQKGDPTYNPAADLNNDGVVNAVDFNLAKQKIG